MSRTQTAERLMIISVFIALLKILVREGMQIYV
jgi:hypothetical protein